MWWQLSRLIQIGLVDHVANAVADAKQKLNKILRERNRVEGQRSHLGDMRAQGTMDTATLNTHNDAEVDGYPFDLALRIAISAPTIAVVCLTYGLQKTYRPVVGTMSPRDQRAIVGGCVATKNLRALTVGY